MDFWYFSGADVNTENRLQHSVFDCIFRQEAGVDLEGTFVQRLVYDDSVSYDLVTAAEKVLGKFGYSSYI